MADSIQRVRAEHNEALCFGSEWPAKRRLPRCRIQKAHRFSYFRWHPRTQRPGWLGDAGRLQVEVPPQDLEADIASREGQEVPSWLFPDCPGSPVMMGLGTPIVPPLLQASIFLTRVPTGGPDG